MFVLEEWHIPPGVWLEQDDRIRQDIWKYYILRADARKTAWMPPAQPPGKDGKDKPDQPPAAFGLKNL